MADREITQGDMEAAPLHIHLELRVNDTRILCQSYVPDEEWNAADPDKRLAEVEKGLGEGVESILRQVKQKDLFA
jgi:hypothetical protein